MDAPTRFPVTEGGALPPCFNCHRPTAGPSLMSGHAPGHGAYYARCSHCGLLTHFDRKEYLSC